MNDQVKAYLRVEVVVSAAFNFFINGMIASLIYHKVDYIPADPVSIGVDLLLTCVPVFILTALFDSASLRRAKGTGLYASERKHVQELGRLFRCPLLFGAAAGLAVAAVLTALAAPVLFLLDVTTVSFWTYIVAKPVFTAVLGSGGTLLMLYIGICGGERSEK